jgi:hypothetical protein
MSDKLTMIGSAAMGVLLAVAIFVMTFVLLPANASLVMVTGDRPPTILRFFSPESCAAAREAVLREKIASSAVCVPR